MPLFRRKPKNTVKLCPTCMKPSLKQASNISGFMTPDNYECLNKECKYVGSFYVEMDLDEVDEEQLKIIKDYQTGAEPTRDDNSESDTDSKIEP